MPEAQVAEIAGVLLCAFRNVGSRHLTGVERRYLDTTGAAVEVLDRESKRSPKRSLGAIGGAVFTAGVLHGAGLVHVAEGAADALALAARLPDPAIALGGTAGFSNADVTRWLSAVGEVEIWADRDGPGLKAARLLAGRVVALGGLAPSANVAAGSDPGDAGVDFAPLDWAVVNTMADDLEADSLPHWEAMRQASTITVGGGNA